MKYPPLEPAVMRKALPSGGYCVRDRPCRNAKIDGIVCVNCRHRAREARAALIKARVAARSG